MTARISLGSSIASDSPPHEAICDGRLGLRCEAPPPVELLTWLLLAELPPPPCALTSEWNEAARSAVAGAAPSSLTVDAAPPPIMLPVAPPVLGAAMLADAELGASAAPFAPELLVTPELLAAAAEVVVAAAGAPALLSDACSELLRNVAKWFCRSMSDASPKSASEAFDEALRSRLRKLETEADEGSEGSRQLASPPSDCAADAGAAVAPRLSVSRPVGESRAARSCSIEPLMGMLAGRSASRPKPSELRRSAIDAD
mmetsp:Transcript_53619/g.106691  ORF Transcript_53619/g.106691 Transcript_53619/m.106691 type:complete len:258 (+) Transcript_53619:699-1472(+)